MKRLQLAIDTLACEADEEQVLDELLAWDGVVAAEIDLQKEQMAVTFDEKVTDKGSLVDFLRFFGIVARPLAAIPS
jgi:copper chaperone CopZ